MGKSSREHPPVSGRVEKSAGSGCGESVAPSPGEGHALGEGDQTKRSSRVERQENARAKRMPPTIDMQLVGRTPGAERALRMHDGKSGSPGGGGRARSDAVMFGMVSDLKNRVHELEARAVKAETELEWAKIDALREKGTFAQVKRSKRRAFEGEGDDPTGCVGGLALFPRRKSLKKAGMFKASAGLQAPTGGGLSEKRRFFIRKNREALSRRHLGSESVGSGTHAEGSYSSDDYGERGHGDDAGNNEPLRHKSVLSRLSTVMNMNARAGKSMLRTQDSSRDVRGIEDVPEAPDAPSVFFGVRGARSERKKKFDLSGY